MSWIKEAKSPKEHKVLEETFGEIDNFDKVANIISVETLNPKALSHHLKFYREVMFGKSGLSRSEREMAAVVVSKVNGCHY
ncbi:MAG: peroxidase [Calditrichaeota bacterium]|nr:MAG: peroxidase [Calditrichota bacterium]